MDLTGAPLLVVLLLAAVGLPAVAVVLWGRLQGPPTLRVGQRLGLVLAAQLAAVLAAGVAVNDQFDLYGSWSDLFGSDPVAAGAVVPAAGGTTDGGTTDGGTTDTGATDTGTTDTGTTDQGPALPGTGRVRVVTTTGPRSRVTAKVWFLLPAGYDDPANASRRYPVIEFFPGYPGTPTTWLHALTLEQTSDAAVAEHRLPPFIGVLPTLNVAAPRDTECTDVVGGPAVATWLAQDVPGFVSRWTRALPPGPAWATTGYSTGGFCAAKLLLQYPRTFGSAAVLAGYFSPSNDVTTGDLFGGQTALRNANDPMWLVQHRPTPPVHLLAVYSDQDPGTLGPTRAFLKAVRPPLTADEIVLARGGHNTGVWSQVEPQVLAWLGSHLATA